MKGKILYFIIGVLGVMAAIIPLTVYHFIEMAGRDDHVTMACHTANRTAAGIGVVIAVVVFIFPVLKNIKNMAVSVLLLASGIALFAVPRVFRLCGSVDMPCRYLTKPTLTALGSMIVILSLVLIARQAVSSHKGPAAENCTVSEV